MGCRQPSAREIFAIEISGDIQNTASRVGLTDAQLSEGHNEPIPPRSFPENGIDLQVTTDNASGNGTTTTAFNANHYVCAFQALGFRNGETAPETTAALQTQVQSFSTPRLSRSRLNSSLTELQVLEYFTRESDDPAGGGNTDNNPNHISLEEWNAFIDARLPSEATEQIIAADDQGNRIVRDETAEEKRARVSEREWRSLESFRRVVRYYNNDTDMGNLVSRFEDRDNEATNAYNFYNTLRQSLTTEGYSFRVFNYSPSHPGNTTVTFTGLSTFLVPAADPNRAICENTDASWSDVTGACRGMIVTANQNAAHREARMNALVSQRAALVDRVRSHIRWEVVGGILAGLACYASYRRGYSSGVRQGAEEIRENVSSETRVAVRREIGTQARSASERAAAALRAFRARAGGSNPIPPEDIDNILQDLTANTARVVEAIDGTNNGTSPPNAPTLTGLSAPDPSQALTNPGAPNPALLHAAGKTPVPRPTGWNPIEWFQYWRAN